MGFQNRAWPFDIKTSVLDSRRALLDTFCTERGLIIANSHIAVKLHTHVIGCTDETIDLPDFSYSLSVKGIRGHRRQVYLSISLNECDKHPRVYVDGYTLDTLTPGDEHLKIGKNRLLYAGRDWYAYSCFPVSPQLCGAFIRIDSSGGCSFAFYDDIPMSDAILLCRHCKPNTTIHDTQELRRLIDAARTLEGTPEIDI